jgi:predicted  nucleic acid-binding Zn-ribbon protein
MSDTARAENMQDAQRALSGLRVLVQHLADELSAFRRRALTAEAKLKELEGTETGAASLDLVRRVGELERENVRLQAQVEGAGNRARQMLDRVKFLRQQAQASPAGGDR